MPTVLSGFIIFVFCPVFGSIGAPPVFECFFQFTAEIVDAGTAGECATGSRLSLLQAGRQFGTAPCGWDWQPVGRQS